MSETARVLLEVVAGIIPQKPDPELTRQWAITSAEWDKANQDGTAHVLLSERNGAAQGYAGLLMLQPDRVNWVQSSWIWL